MKLNNKGFATTAIMYSILTLILMLLLGSMAYLANRKKVLDKIKQDTYNEVNEIIYGNLEPEDFEYTGNYQVYKVMKSGYYKVELWGASGGEGKFNNNVGTELGGAGAYTSGYIYMDKGTSFYIYVGGAGTSATSVSQHATIAGGFNGGGNGISGGTDDQAGSAGGATDIRFGGTSINDRIMVAAGGGGGHCDTNTAYGNNRIKFPLINGQGLLYTGTLGQWQNGTYSVAASQTSGNAFAIGGSYTNLDSTHGAGGGGGGYYGGVANKNNNGGPGSGGTSFISGYAGVNAITSSTSTTPTNNTKHYSGKYFIGGVMKAGNELMPTHDGTSTMIGNSGNGYAKISYVGDTITRKDTRLNNVRYIKSCMNGNTANAGNHWVEIQAIKDGVNIAKGKSVTGTYPQNNSTTNAYSYVVDGLFDNITGSSGFGYPTNSTNSCITVDLGTTYNLDEIASWNWWVDGRGYYNNIVSVSSNNSTWINIYSNFESETTQGKRVNAYVINDNSNYLFNYTGSQQLFTAPTTGYYKFESWGAQGGTSGSSAGGNGAYTSGIIKLDKDDPLYIYVGSHGGQNATVTNVGGYNGGGYSGNNGGANSYGGGGSTDVRTTSGTWNTAASLASRIMVAAGGGGGTAGSTTTAGAGGVLIGLSGTSSNATYNNATYLPLGGTQIAGGFGYQNSSVRNGQWGMGVQTNSSGWGGGGGSGYYGGGNGHGTTGAGGSSFISGYAGVNAITSASSTSPSNNTRHYSGKYFIGGNMISGLNTGNGKASITYLGDLNEEKVFNNNYQRLEYIQSTGTQYIDTGFKATPNTIVDISYQFTEVSTLQQRLFGSGTSSDSYLNYQMYINGAGAWAYAFKDGSGNWVSTNVKADTNKHNIRFNIPLGQFTIDNNSYSIASSTRTKSTQNNILIMYATPSDSGEKIGKMKLYAFKMYDKNELVRDMIPVKRKSDNAIGLYDKVTKKFYGNAGTGTFTAGPVIDLTNVRYIKDCVNGNKTDNTNRWNEIQAIKDGVNLAKGKTATLANGGAVSKPENVTDGDIGKDGGTDSYSGSQCILIDLGSTYNLDEVAVWYNWHSSYSGLKEPTTYVSSNNSTWRTVISGNANPSADGKRVSSHY